MSLYINTKYVFLIKKKNNNKLKLIHYQIPIFCSYKFFFRYFQQMIYTFVVYYCEIRGFLNPPVQLCITICTIFHYWKTHNIRLVTTFFNWWSFTCTNFNFFDISINSSFVTTLKNPPPLISLLVHCSKTGSLKKKYRYLPQQ